jgi:hypothetical protein
MNTRSAVPDLLTTLDFKVLAMQRVKMQRGWNFEQVISPFAHLWFLVAGRATIKHHGRAFELRAGASHLITPFTLHDCHGEDFLDCFQLHFLSHVPGGTELFSTVDCDGQVAEPPDFQPLLERLWAICSGRDLSPNATPGESQSRTISLAPGKNGIPLAQGVEAQAILRQLLKPFLNSVQIRQGAPTPEPEPFPAVQEFISRGWPVCIPLIFPTVFYGRWVFDRWNI